MGFVGRRVSAAGITSPQKRRIPAAEAKGKEEELKVPMVAHSMEASSAQPSRVQALVQQSRRLQPLRFVFLFIIFLQLYLSNSVSLPSICGILLSCAVYTIYVDIKAKRSPDVRSMPSPSTFNHKFPPLSSTAPGPDCVTDSRDTGELDPSLPSQPSRLEDAPVARNSDNASVYNQVQHQEQARQQDHTTQQQQTSRSQGLSTLAAPWEPTDAKVSSASLFGAKQTSAAVSTNPSQPPTSTIFVGNMSSVVTENDLLQMFSPFGDIIVARIQRGSKQKGLKMCALNRCSSVQFSFSPALNSLRFIGFVDFFAVDSAIAAIRSLQGLSLCGRPMRLEFSQVWHRCPHSRANAATPRSLLHHSPSYSTPCRHPPLLP